MHLNWKGMFHDSSLFAVPNTVDGGRDNLPGDAAHTTISTTTSVGKVDSIIQFIPSPNVD